MFQRLKDDIKALLAKFSWTNLKSDATEVEAEIKGFLDEIARLEGVLAEIFGPLLKNKTLADLIALTGIPGSRLGEIIALVQPIIDKLEQDVANVINPSPAPPAAAPAK